MLNSKVKNALRRIARSYGWETTGKIWSATSGFNATNLEEIIKRYQSYNKRPRADLTDCYEILHDFDDFWEEIPKFFNNRVKSLSNTANSDEFGIPEVKMTDPDKYMQDVASSDSSS